MDAESVLFLAIFGLAALSGCAATILVRRRLWLVLPLAGLGILAAIVYLEDAAPDKGEYSDFAPVITAGIPLVGWLLGLAASSAWYVGHHSGERPRHRSQAARS